MPRPGPRPYEFVRKAWHSDRHQPIRGSLIQEIFRVVNEVHSAATKKNKEWQEKLPIVVLKAEEIMYSKANSEAEYMDLKTLWDRANDAINTIIRRDEGTESGKLLQPCIEAALNLGCTPRRASRSHRNSNARCYLSPATQEPPSVSPGTVESARQGTYSTSSQYMSRCSNFVSPASLISNCPSPVAQNKDFAANMSPFSSEDTLPSCYNTGSSKENYPASNSYAVYPVHYVNRHQFKEPQHFPILSSNTLGPAKLGLENLFPCNVDASYKLTESNSRATPEKQSKIGCDLSLRLGPVSETFPSVRNCQLKDVEDTCSGNSQNGSKVRDQSPQVDKKFLFPGGNQYAGLLGSYSSKWSFEGRHRNVEATMRKRKAAFYHPADDQQFCWHPKLPGSHLTGSMRNAGS